MFNSFMRLNTITKITDCHFNKGFCSFKPNTVKKKQQKNKTEPHLIRPTLARHQVAPSLRQIRSSQQLQELLAFPLERGRLPDTRESQRVLPGPGGPGSCHALWGSCPGHTCGLWISSKLPPRAPPPFRPHSPPPSLNPPPPPRRIWGTETNDLWWQQSVGRQNHTNNREFLQRAGRGGKNFSFTAHAPSLSPWQLAR